MFDTNSEIDMSGILSGHLLSSVKFNETTIAVKSKMNLLTNFEFWQCFGKYEIKEI